MTRSQIRAWGLIVFFLAAVAIHNIALISSKPAAELALKMRVTVTPQRLTYLARSAALVTATFDTGRGFNDAKKVVRGVATSPDFQNVFLPVPTGTTRTIRLDPLEGAGTVEIREALIQRPVSHTPLRQFALSEIKPANENTSLDLRDGYLEVTTAVADAGGQLLLSCDPPLKVSYLAQQILTPRFFRVNAIWLLVGILLFLVDRSRHRWQPSLLRLIGRVDRTFEIWTNRFANSAVLPLDRTAIWYYVLCFLLFATMAVVGLHGSSIAIYGSNYGYGPAKHHPLVGTPKGTRVDEWNYHTPTILNQLLRQDRLAAETSQFGSDNAALFANVPTRHWSEWFRPQFWVFHCLPLTIAYAFYWQTKGLLLLTGTFSLLLLLTRSSTGAVLGALWYFFSTHTQWCFSWPTLLPEMVGLFGWVICLTAYMTVGQSKWRLALAAFVCSVFAIDFALCAYPPHQFPLVILGVLLLAWWLWAKRDLIIRKDAWLARSLAAAGCLLLIALALGLFYVDVRLGFRELANTVYPGHRLVEGGNATVAQMLSHLMDFWKNERRYPTELGNICEAAGFLWLAPATLLLPRSFRKKCEVISVSPFLWLAFLILAAWMLLPIPTTIGKILMLDKVTPNRCIPTLGLINVALVAIFLSRLKQQGSAVVSWKELASFAGVLILLFGLLAYMNSVYHHFFGPFELLAAALYITFLVLFLRNNWRSSFATALLLPAIATTALVNPLDRGFDVVLKSSVAAKVQQQPELKDNRWLVFCSWVTLPGFFSACGLNLANGIKIIPALNELTRFDPEGKYRSVFNQSCYLVAQVHKENDASEFETPNNGVVIWKVNPLDPRLKEIGIKYLAFDSPPDPSIRQQLRVILEEESNGIWAYELP